MTIELLSFSVGVVVCVVGGCLMAVGYWLGRLYKL